MKIYLGLLAVIFLIGVVFGADVTPPFLRVSRDEGGCQLQWTNCACSTRPVHQILGANSPTGSWSRIARVTNSTSFVLPTTNQMKFFRLAWTGDDDWSFDYIMYHDNGALRATGSMSLIFSGLLVSAPYSMYDFDLGSCEWCPHNPRTGTFSGSINPTRSTVALNEVLGFGLTGSYYTVTNSAGCLVTEMSGIVWEGDFIEPSPTGYWRATSKSR